MDRTELQVHLDQYETLTIEIVNGKHDLLAAEWDAKDAVRVEAEKLLGGDNPQTGKPHSWTSAEKSTKESTWNREQQIGMQRKRGAIEVLESKSRSLYILLGWLIQEPATVVA